MRRILLAAIAALASVASAQLYPNHLSLSQSGAMMIGNPTVRAELKVTADQWKQIESVLSRHSREQLELSKGLANASEQKILAAEARMEALEKDTANQILGELQAGQKSRLLGIVLQHEGAFAVTNSEVAGKLKITSAQSQKIAAIKQAQLKKEEAWETAVAAKLQGLGSPKSTKPADLAAHQKKRDAAMASLKSQEKAIDSARAKAQADILATLTPAQRQQWKQMLGAKLKL